MKDEDMFDDDKSLPDVAGSAIQDEEARQLLLESFLNQIDALPQDTTMRAAWMYDRKGYPSQTPLSNPQNKSYGSDIDDVLIQVTVRVPRWENALGHTDSLGNHHDDSLGKLVSDRLLSVEDERMRLEADAEIDDLKAKLEQAEAKRRNL